MSHTNRKKEPWKAIASRAITLTARTLRKTRTRAPVRATLVGVTMPTKREYAASLGLAVAGARGRLSREAHAAIAKAESDGMTFDDPKPVVNTPKASKPVTRKPVVVHDAGIAGDVLTKWPDDQIFVGTDSHGKTHKVNARQVCRNSGYSMTSCPCGQTHVVLVPSMEHIEVVPRGG